MKNLILIILFLIGLNSSSQQNELFKPGVKLVENPILLEIEANSSVLFVFNGNTHLINYYQDLAKKLKKQFRKSKQILKFNYELTSNKPLESDLKSIPQQKYNTSEYDIVCYITTVFIKSWDNHLVKKRKLNYELNLRMVNSKTNVTMETAKINIHGFYTILTQNKNSSKLIYQLLTD